MIKKLSLKYKFTHGLCSHNLPRHIIVIIVVACRQVIFLFGFGSPFSTTIYLKRRKKNNNILMQGITGRWVRWDNIKSTTGSLSRETSAVPLSHLIFHPEVSSGCDSAGVSRIGTC